MTSRVLTTPRPHGEPAHVGPDPAPDPARAPGTQPTPGRDPADPGPAAGRPGAPVGWVPPRRLGVQAGEAALDRAIQEVGEILLSQQDPAGYWVHELEADATITSEYLLLRRWLGIADPTTEAKAVRHLKAVQLAAGGWPIYHNGPANLSATVKAYFALKLAGVPSEAPEMLRARQTVLELGGITKVNVFTRILLALFGEFDWQGIPCMPVEICLLPRWFYFNLYQISYWSRTVLVPLLIIFAHRPVRPVPRFARLDELYLEPRELATYSLPRDPEIFTWRNVFLVVDRLLRIHDRFVPRSFRRPAIEVADLPPAVRGGPEDGAAPSDGSSFKDAKQQVIERFERRFILAALERHHGNVSKAAEEMGMYRQHLQLKLGEYGIDPERYRRRPER